MATARVLVVDDESFFRYAVSKTLSRHGYEVLQADGPRQALETLGKHYPIDVVLSDVQMPEMQGTDLVREIAAALPGTACVLMTGGRIGAADIPKGVPVLYKPVLRLDLIAAVEAAKARSTTWMVRLQHSRDESSELREITRHLRVCHHQTSGKGRRQSQPFATARHQEHRI